MIEPVDRLLTEIGEGLKAFDKFMTAYQPQLALGFDPIGDILGLDEMRSSAILAYFLDPKRKHGQGRIFLESFLDLAQFPKELSQGAVEVTIEKHTQSHGNFDIFVEFKDQHSCFIIENKIGAPDGYNQLADYRRWLNSKNYKADRLYYLTPDGKDSSTKSLTRYDTQEIMSPEEAKVQTLSWRHQVLALMDRWSRMAKSPTVRAFLELARKAIGRKIGEGEIMEEAVVFEAIGKSEDHLRAAKDIFDSWQSYQNNLLEKEFKAALERFAHNLGFRLEPSGTQADTLSDFSFYKEGWKHVCICFEFDSDRYRNIDYGIAKLPEYSSSIPWEDVVAAAEKKEIAKQNSGPEWLVAKKMDAPYNDWLQRDALIGIYQSTRDEKTGILVIIKKCIEEFQGKAQELEEYLAGSRSAK